MLDVKARDDRWFELTGEMASDTKNLVFGRAKAGKRSIIVAEDAEAAVDGIASTRREGRANAHSPHESSGTLASAVNGELPFSKRK